MTNNLPNNNDESERSENAKSIKLDKKIENTDNDFNNILAKIFALVAAASIALMTSFDLGTKSNNIVRAWRLLNAAIIKFNNVEENGDVQKVIESYEKAEEIIGDVTYRDTGNH